MTTPPALLGWTALVVVTWWTAPTRAEVRSAPPPSVRATYDVRYHPGRGRQTLDVFAPRGGAGVRRPVVLFVHGGTWMFGDKNFFGVYRRFGKYLAQQGVVAVLINYRLSPMVRHPEHVKDVARAYAWTVGNIARYGGDPNRIILAGHSAGGHLVSLLATDERYLKDPALKLTPQGRAGLKGVVSVSGVYCIPGPEEFREMLGNIVALLVTRNQMGGLSGYLSPVLMKAGEKINPFHLVFGKDREVQKQASPLTHVRKGLPPFLILYAESEVSGLPAMAETFGKALRESAVPVEVMEMEGCSHKTIIKALQKKGDPGAKALLEFVRRVASGSHPVGVRS